MLCHDGCLTVRSGQFIEVQQCKNIETLFTLETRWCSGLVMYFRFDALFKLMAYYVLNNEAEIRIREVNCLRTYEHHQSV